MTGSEQGIVFDIKRFAVHDGPGIRTTLFFKGCPLNCAWCHNPESIAPGPELSEKEVIIGGRSFCQTETVGTTYSIRQLFNLVMKDQVFWEESGGGVTFSGGEPLLQHRFTFDLMNVFIKNGVHVTIDTSGFIPQTIFNRFADEGNLFLFDLKLIDDLKHQHYTGVSNRLIHDNFKSLIDRSVPVRVRIPVIPDVNFNDQDLAGFLTFLSPFRLNIQGIDLLPYHNIAGHKYSRFHRQDRMAGTASLTKTDLINWKNRFENEGYEVKIGG